MHGLLVSGSYEQRTSLKDIEANALSNDQSKNTLVKKTSFLENGALSSSSSSL